MEDILPFLLVPKKSLIHLTLTTIEPVALTSHSVGVFEWLLLTHLSKQTNTLQHQVKFAFCHEVRIEVVVTHLLQ